MSANSKLRILKIPAQKAPEDYSKYDGSEQADEGVVDHVLRESLFTRRDTGRPDEQVIDQASAKQKEKTADDRSASGPN